jgi:sporulation protein YlmC with PRC-barrel domain
MSTEHHEPDADDAPTASAAAGESFQLGASVHASDGECGQLTRVVVNPAAQSVTHLVVAPKHHKGLGRLVPVNLVQAADGEHIRLSCTTGHFLGLDDAEQIEFLPADTSAMGYGSGAMMWPAYGDIGMPLSGSQHEPMIVDRVPTGEVEVRRGDPVHASDGWIGSVQGVVIDPKDHRVTHVLLKEGHLWGRKQVAIPIGAASRVDDVIRVDLTKEQVEQLPPAELRSGE